MFDDETMAKLFGLPADKISAMRVESRLHQTIDAARALGPIGKWGEMKALLLEAAELEHPAGARGTAAFVRAAQSALGQRSGATPQNEVTMFDDETMAKLFGLPADKISAMRVESRLHQTIDAARALGPIGKWGEMKALLLEAAELADTLEKAKAAGL